MSTRAARLRRANRSPEAFIDRNDLAVSANGAATFTSAVASGDTYDIRVLTQPSSPAQRCMITNGSGSVSNAAITGPTIDCVTHVPHFAYSAAWLDSSISIYGVDATTGQLRSRGYVRTGGAATGTQPYRMVLTNDVQ